MSTTPFSLAFSTCPNDTFIFGHLVREPGIEAHLHDVETLNRWAFEERFDVTKLSFAAWLQVRERYELLPVGAALGRGCGPMVIVQRNTSPDFPGCTVAVPGEFTTAHLLLRLWKPDIQTRVFMPFNRIMDAVAAGTADAGVIIHEGRFVYEDRGFECVQDLGAWWESTTGKPIPLGCIAARKSLGPERIAEIGRRLRRSIESAFDNPASVAEYVKAHAQELDDEVIRQHIKTYVNPYTLDLGDDGRAAIDVLQRMARQAGIIQ